MCDRVAVSGMKSFNDMCGCVDGDDVDLTCVERVSEEAGSAGIKIFLSDTPPDSGGGGGHSFSAAVTAAAGGVLALIYSI
jgi:hypothetical protein